MSPRILAVDPGSNEVGLYWGPGKSRTLYLTDPRLTKSKRAKVSRPERLAALAEQLAAFLAEWRFDFAVYEEQFVRGGGATKALFGAVGVIEAVLTTCSVGVMSVPQSTLRKWAKPGIAAASPKELYAKVAAFYDPRPTMTEHEKDACVLWHFIQERGIF